MTIVDELKGLITARGGQTVGVRTIADACKVLSQIESKINNPLKMLAVEGDFEATTDQLFGKALSDIQENIVVNMATGKITGVCHYISGWANFSSSEELQNGHYLALHVDVEGESDVVYTSQLTRKVTLDDDQIVIIRIEGNTAYPVVITASKSGYTPVTRTFDISGLLLEPEEF